MHGTGQEPFWRAGVLRRPPFNIEYQNRLREIRDLLFNPEQADALIDEYAAVISDPTGGPSFVDADRAKWDYHPIMVSPFVLPSRAGHGQFYLQSPTKDFRGMVQLMKDYVRIRARWCDTNLLTDPAVPSAPSIAAVGPLATPGASLKFNALPPSAPGLLGVVEWRLAEVTLGPVAKPPVARQYEIEALWQSEGNAAAEIPAKLVQAGRTYRVRARMRDVSGRCSHWSEPVQFIVGK
jgi:hypothetical protein